MQIIYITQRVNINNSTNERVDALDQKWVDFLYNKNEIIIPICNNIMHLHTMIREIPPNVIILSGGNTSCIYGGDAKERDELDGGLIQYAIEKQIPLFGVCRGMQSINLFYGGTLKKVHHHVGKKHKIFSESNSFINVVNSYHNYVCDNVPTSLKVMARAEDGEVEAFKALKDKVFGIMWHPERSNGSYAQEVELIKKVFGK